MRPLLRLRPNVGSRGLLTARWYTSAALTYGGRTAPYRRIQSDLLYRELYGTALPSSPPTLPSSRISLCLPPLYNTFSTTSRGCAISFRDLKSDGKSKDSQKQGPRKENTRAEEDPAEKAYRAATEESAARSRRQREEEKERLREEEAKEKEESSESESKDDAGQKKHQKQDEPPPPPHGNKSPWQVFTETLKTEFQASKEWNESTKQLSASATHFSENESVKRARAAYEAASGAATSGTAQALKGTAKAVGHGAAWTWDSLPMQGIRSGVNATGRGIEAATRPVRETKIYKSVSGNVKEVIDDGSSSKYGGWVEKEERRKKRELRELKEAAGSGRSGRRNEKMEEDPKYGQISFAGKVRMY